MAKTFREGMPMPTNPDDMTAKKKVKKPAPRTKLPALKPGEYDAPMEPDMGSVGKKRGGKIMREHGGEHYANKAVKRKHEKAESPAKERMEEGMMCGGSVKKMASGGGVRGGGIAQRGVGKGRMC